MKQSNNQGNEKKCKNQNKNEDKSKITCYACRRKFHFARDCLSNKQVKGGIFERSENSSNYRGFSSEIGKTVFQSEEQWILNSE